MKYYACFEYVSMNILLKDLPLLGMLPLLSVVSWTQPPTVFVGVLSDADVVLERDGCLSDLERISVRRLAAISDLVSAKQRSVVLFLPHALFPKLARLKAGFAPRAEFRLWIRFSFGFKWLRLVLAARFKDL